MKVIKIDYYTNLLVKDEELLTTMSCLLKAKVISGNEVKDLNFSLEEAPDMVGKLSQEAEQYKKWWLESQAEVKKLKEGTNA